MAAKLNGYLAGAKKVEEFDRVAPTFGLSEKIIQNLREKVLEREGYGLYCQHLKIIINLFVIEEKLKKLMD